MNHESKHDASGLITYELGSPGVEEKKYWRGQITTSEIDALWLRLGEVTNYTFKAVWPLVHGEKSQGMSSTLEGWMKGQRG